MTVEWRRVGEKRGEGTVNRLEPRSQGGVAGKWDRGDCKRSQVSRPVSMSGGDDRFSIQWLCAVMLRIKRNSLMNVKHNDGV